MKKPTKEEFEYYQEQVFIRYNHKCVRCLRKAQVVHEMLPKSLYYEWWKDIDNGVSLCISCHFWAHRFGSKQSREKLQEYLHAFRF